MCWMYQTIARSNIFDLHRGVLVRCELVFCGQCKGNRTTIYVYTVLGIIKSMHDKNLY